MSKNILCQKQCCSGVFKLSVPQQFVSFFLLTLFATGVNATDYTINVNSPQQTILGLGVELQLDSIGSGNNGLPEQRTGIPHELIDSERQRLYKEMLQGFRYARLAMGLYYRGLTLDEKNLAERYPGQLEELRVLIERSGMEGASAEYWSPTPFWKEGGSYIGGEIRNNLDYDAFGDAIVKDIKHFEDGGVPVVRWSLQNEPFTNNNRYSNAFYPRDGRKYYQAFMATASKVRSYNPNIFIHTDSGHGQKSSRVDLIHEDPAALALVDGWSWHKIGTNSDDQIKRAAYYNSETHGKPVYNNEFEYLDNFTNQWRMINTAQSIMNWMTFMNSPTWYWLHALKPTYNKESEGYGLGLWRPENDGDFTKYRHIKRHHWDYLNTNWHGMAGFVKYMPWNSVRHSVDEVNVRFDQRIMAWKTPSGQMVFALTNRSDQAFTFEIDISQTSGEFSGRRYDRSLRDHYLGEVSGNTVTITVPPFTIEYWLEHNKNKPTFAIEAVRSSMCENRICYHNDDTHCRLVLGHKGIFKVTRMGDNLAPATVQLKDRSSASMGEDFEDIPMDIHFARGQRQRIIWIDGIDDRDGETIEQVTLELVNSHYYNVTDKGLASIALHDDADPVRNWVSVYAMSAGNESSAPVVVKLIRRGELTGALTVDLEYGGSASQDNDYLQQGRQVTFGHGESEKIIRIPVLDDTLYEEHETLSVALLPSPNYYVGSPIATQKITDNERPATQIIDNTMADRIEVRGSWAASSFSPSRIGTNYLHDKRQSKGEKSVSYYPEITLSGQYTVSLFYNNGGDRASAVPVTVTHADGSDTVIINQQDNGGQWVDIGTYYFDVDDQSVVTISNAGTSGYVIADAVRLEAFGDVLDNTAQSVISTGEWAKSSFFSDRVGQDYLHDRGAVKGALRVQYQWQAPKDGLYLASIYYNSASDRATNVPVHIDYGEGEESHIVDQTQNGGRWVTLGAYPLSKGKSAVITISNDNTDGVVIADGIRWVAVGN